ncbi:TPA: hypothetical protein ACF86T_002536 [Staphylococcus aureus]|uniref:Lipoprotein n=2 Tax=Staphylococcus aureus TaxID=1280 RepID=D2J7N9_STAAU|nr:MULTISPECIES: hypothetical protein [Staphylococcus]ACZ58788.1 hypothetical protein SAP031A_046 [Staphylococcus aureus]ACZ66226.1 hypothetical protein SAP030A_030 [Staphylococcus aureus]AIU96706.1 hypothetical protein [Staphylococcus aureus]ALH99481.1 hypothetical protein ACH32_14340 [Staphylococcus aureus]AOF44150.1 hypothetical protein pWBG637_00024 [Staphylococcus aureus]
MKNIFGFVFFLSVVLLLSGCSKSGIEEISPKEAHDKLKNPKNEYVIAISDLSRAGEEHIYNSKKILEKVAEEKGIKIYYAIYDSNNEKHEKDFDEYGKFKGHTSNFYYAEKGKKVEDMDYKSLGVAESSKVNISAEVLGRFIDQKEEEGF